MDDAVSRYVAELMDPYSPYYSNGLLNSEGMTLLKVIARSVLAVNPSLKPRFAKARRLRDYEHVSSLMADVAETLRSGREQ